MVLDDMLDAINKRKRKREREKTAKRIVAGVSAAAAAGIAAGILIAPKSGKETRDIIKKKAVDTTGTIKDAVQRSAEKIKNSASNVAAGISGIATDEPEKAVSDKDSGHLDEAIK